jgi:TRAP transporter TAXI family solute receptor
MGGGAASFSAGAERAPGRRAFLRGAAAGAWTLAAGLLGGCDVREFAYRHGAKRRLSIATAGTGGVYYVYGGAIARVVSRHLPNVEATAEVTGGGVDNLYFLARGVADLAIAAADMLDDAVHRRGAFARAPRTPARALATLYGNHIHLATFADRGIATLADLRGRRVSTGPPGAASEIVALRILRAAGLDPDRDLRRERISFAASAEALKDGKIDAFFAAAGVPNPAVLDVASARGRRLRLVPTAEALPALRRDHGHAVYHRFVIAAGAYPGLDADVPVIGIHNVLVADERLDAVVAHDITRALFVHRAELEAVHRAARELTHASAVANSPVPFHDGAVRYYRSVGAWPG